jgi:hypothetical protein
VWRTGRKLLTAGVLQDHHLFSSHGGSYKLAGFFLSVACEMLGRGAWRMHGTGLTLSMSQVFWTGGSSTKRRDLAG